MKRKGLRWWVVGLVALAAIINYIDRQAFGALWPEIAGDLFPDMTADETKNIYGNISAIFILSYAAGQTIFGKIFDWIGTRIGFAISIGVWSFATAIHAFAQGFMSFAIFRSILGIAEAGNWPGAAKANAEWFPTKERAFAQGIFNSGAAIGGIVAYPIIGLLSVYLSWQAIFICVALLGFLWLLPWLYIVKAPPEAHPWLSDSEMIGAWFGGLLAQNRLNVGWNVNKTRKFVITLGCLIMIPCFFLLKAPGTAVNAVLIMAVLLFGFQTAIGNVQTLPSDMFSGKTVGTLSGFAGTGAKLGAFGLTLLIPVITKGGNYEPAFLIGVALAVIALIAVWVLCPKIEPLKPVI